MRGHTPFFELETALGERGCVICDLTVRALDRFFAGLVYEKVNDRSLRAAIRRAFGLCATHATMLRAARSALGVSIIQRDVLRAAAAAISGTAGGRRGLDWRDWLPGTRSAGGPLAPDGPCVACQLADETAGHWAGVLSQHYGELRPRFQASAGLCLTHLSTALLHASGEAAGAIRDDQLAIWGRLEAELDEFIRKHDHQFADEGVGSERDAWARAALLAGDERAVGSRRGRL